MTTESRSPATEAGSDRPFEPTLTRVSPLLAVAIGCVGVLLAVGLALLFGDDSSRFIHAALFIPPVIVAGLLGGRAAALAVAAVAAVAFAMFLEPIGSPTVHTQADLIALGVFALAAAVSGVLVAQVLNTERRRAAAERGRLEALERTERQRKALLRSVSHDLRTPLATIRGATEELYVGDGYDGEQRHELLALVLLETERLDRIVANMLSLSRIDAGALLPDRHPVQLDELVETSVERLATVLAGHTVVVDAHDPIPPVALDRSQIDQVVTNVLENAARHSPAGSTITVDLRSSDDEVVVEVLDDGRGFPPGSEDKLFEPFAMATGAGSSGIGLAICRSIVEAHGGSVGAGNRPEGGARITIRLPRRT